MFLPDTIHINNGMDLRIWEAHIGVDRKAFKDTNKVVLRLLAVTVLLLPLYLGTSSFSLPSYPC